MTTPTPRRKPLPPLNTLEGLIAYFDNMALEGGERLAVPGRLLEKFVNAVEQQAGHAIELDIRYSYGTFYIRRLNHGEN